LENDLDFIPYEKDLIKEPKQIIKRTPMNRALEYYDSYYRLIITSIEDIKPYEKILEENYI
jgi:hypothetical protein